MEQIYAPWRIEWVTREDDPIDGCPFCVLPSRADAREARVVAQSEHNYVLLNNAPYNPGHAMVIPHEHHTDWRELDAATMLDHGRLKAATIDALCRGVDPDGFNTGLNLGDGAAGGSIEHLHTHVVPRWDGDTNFMPVVGETTVIVEAVDRTYTQLHEAFGEVDAGAGVNADADADADANADADADANVVVDTGDADAGEAVRLAF